MELSEQIFKRLAKQLYFKAERLRRVGMDPVPNPNHALYLSEEEILKVLASVYGDDWKEKLCEEVEVHPDFKDID